ncbi:replication protein A 70 kDa DNA-binding subunit B-like [Abeliophyllum distichum]|uniref:Replication protein A 70 kDa DNA-binding subunit B-like n=1 Tax=Abeliophyllum distichum TaxID=126358 RepID=A0ABD1UQ68_9LAMI
MLLLLVGGSRTPQAGGLHFLADFNLQSDLDIAVQFSAGVSGGAISGSTFHVVNPSPNFPSGISMAVASNVSPVGDSRKKKRGRPRKYAPEETRIALSPMSSTPSSRVISLGEKSREFLRFCIGIGIPLETMAMKAFLLQKFSVVEREQSQSYMLPGIIGMVIDTRPKRMIQTRSGNQCQVQDIILINKRLETILLTMWENFVDNECNYICENLAKKPVIIAKHLKVSSFNGISLSTKANSSFFIDGPFDIVEHFKTWAKKNVETLNNIMSEKCYLHLTPSKISLPNKSKYTEIKNIQGLQKTYHNSKAAPRARVYLQLMDSTGYINATAIGEPAESFLLCNANTLMNHSVSNPDSNIIDLIRLATEEEKTFYIKEIQQNQEATEFKYELLFVLGRDSTVTAGNQQSKDKGKSPMLEDEQAQQMDSKHVTPPPTKRSLFQTPETPLPTKKKTEIDTNKDKDKKEV